MSRIFKRITVIAAAIVVLACSAFYLMGTRADNYAIEIDDELKSQIALLAQEEFDDAPVNGFVIVVAEIHAAYRQDGTIRAFATVYYSRYEILSANKIARGGSASVPVSITYRLDSDGNILDPVFVLARDGDYFPISIREFCVLPSGRKINGLPEKIMSLYGNHDVLKAMHDSAYRDYLAAHGMKKYRLVDPGYWSSIEATVIENNVSTLLVEPVENIYRDLLPDRIIVDITKAGLQGPGGEILAASDITVGLKVRIETKDLVVDTDPAQINMCYQVVVLSQSEEFPDD